MREYALQEMLGLLKLGLWSGGYISDVGYLGSVAHTNSKASGCGELGITLGYDIMLEHSWDERELNISIYDFYSGSFVLHTLYFMSGVQKEALITKLIEIVEEIRKKLVWSHNLYKRNVFAIERRYGAEYTSFRAGKIITTRKSKFFGR